MMMLFEEDLFEGKVVKARFNNTQSPTWHDIFIPVRIEKEYPRWYLCTVLPHFNEKEGMSESKEYPMTIDKFALRTGEVVCIVA